MTRRPFPLSALFPLLLLVAIATMAADAPAPPGATVEADTAPSATTDPEAPKVPESPDLSAIPDTPPPAQPLCPGGCSGTLGEFVEPSCYACNATRLACQSACQSHGGMVEFHCAKCDGIYCECADGAYDSCGCGSDPC